jgi:hypothetical protein
MIGIPYFPVSQNHYHLVVHVDQTRARGWTMHEVIERWTLGMGTFLISVRSDPRLCQRGVK